MRTTVWMWLGLLSLVSCAQGCGGDSGPPGPDAPEGDNYGSRVWTLDDIDAMWLEETPPESLSNPVLANLLRQTRRGLSRNNRHAPFPGQQILPVAWSGVTILSCDGARFEYRANCEEEAPVQEAPLPSQRADRIFSVECSGEAHEVRIEFLDLRAAPDQEPEYARRAALVAAWLEKNN